MPEIKITISQMAKSTNPFGVSDKRVEKNKVYSERTASTDDKKKV